MRASTEPSDGAKPDDSVAEDSVKIQCNVYLPRGLVRRIKHRAIDDGVSLSALVERALTTHLEQP